MNHLEEQIDRNKAETYDKVKHFVIIINSAMVILFGFAYGINSLMIDCRLLAAADFTMGTAFIFVLGYTLKNPSSKLPYFLSVTSMSLFFLYLFATGGAGNTGYLWSVIIPLCAIFMLGWKAGVFYSLGYFVSMNIAVCLDYFGIMELNLPDQEILSRLFTVYIIASIVAAAYEISKNKAEEQLKEAKFKAEQANRAKSDFLAVMSHEIRTPLHGVLGSTDLLKKTDLNEIQKEYTEIASVSGRILLGVLDDILDFSKIEAGKLELEIIETDLTELVQNTVKMIRYLAEQKNLKMIVDIQDSIPARIMTDPVRLRQVLVNLLNNSVKFTEKGQIELKVTFEPGGNKWGYFTFSVHDTGIGISEEQKSRLFKAFSQADGSIARKFGGTGLGLMISKLLVEKMGGRINLESEPGKGTRFFFTIETGYKEKS
jgi:signal transduction histidine kinase